MAVVPQPDGVPKAGTVRGWDGAGGQHTARRMRGRRLGRVQLQRVAALERQVHGTERTAVDGALTQAPATSLQARNRGQR